MNTQRSVDDADVVGLLTSDELDKVKDEPDTSDPGSAVAVVINLLVLVLLLDVPASLSDVAGYVAVVSVINFYHDFFFFLILLIYDHGLR